jgi:aryl-phospho-beta-D-glucosidase BglC (GH1 family)
MHIRSDHAWANKISYHLNIDVVHAQLPFYIGIVKNDPVSVLSDKLGSNSDLVGLSALQIMDKIIDEAAKRGILIMLDLHSFNVLIPRHGPPY